MSSVLDSAKKHYSDLIDGELKFVDVLEWEVDGKPTRIYYRQYLTVEEKGELVKLYNQDSHYEMMVMSLIHSARSQDGTKLFKKAEKYDLMKYVSADVIETIFSKMGLFAENEDVAKK